MCFSLRRGPRSRSSSITILVFLPIQPSSSAGLYPPLHPCLPLIQPSPAEYNIPPVPFPPCIPPRPLPFRKRGTRLLHVAGTSLFIAQATAAAATRDPRLVASGIISAYGLAWASHFFIERNRPATFRYPLFSLLGDFRMLYEILTGKEPLSASP